MKIKTTHEIMEEYASLKLTRSWLKEHCGDINICGHCGRWLTDEEFKKHKETRCD